MVGQNHYLITSLPSLGPLGSAPPIEPAELLELLGDSPGPRQLAEAVLLGDDLLQRQGCLAGEVREVRPAVLTREQATGEQPLPAYLAGDGTAVVALVGEDATWAAYLRWAAEVARRWRNAFLAAWVAYEAAARNALAAARARALHLDPQPYLVAPELGERGLSFDALLGEWAAAPTPLEGLRVLDQARWDWLNEHENWFSFSDDELAAYAAKLMLLYRWHRLAEAAEPTALADAPAECHGHSEGSGT
jgi:hypothetical protein